MSRVSLALPGDAVAFHETYDVIWDKGIADFEARPPESTDPITVLGLDNDSKATRYYTDEVLGFGQTLLDPRLPLSTTNVNTCVVAAARTTDALLAEANDETPRLLAPERLILSHYGIDPPPEANGSLFSDTFSRLMRITGYAVRAAKESTPLASVNRTLGAEAISYIHAGDHVWLVGAAFLANGRRISFGGGTRQRDLRYQVWDPLAAGATRSDLRYTAPVLTPDELEAKLGRSPIVLGVRASLPRARVRRAEPNQQTTEPRVVRVPRSAPRREVHIRDRRSR